MQTIEFIAAILTALEIGFMIGGFFEKRRQKHLYEPIVDDYRQQKKDMWNRVRRRV